MQTRPPNPFASSSFGGSEQDPDATIRRPLGGSAPYAQPGMSPYQAAPFGAQPAWGAQGNGFASFGGAPKDDPFGFSAGGRDPLDFGFAPGPSFGDFGKMAKYQDIITFVDDDHRMLTSRMLGDDGTWSHFMTAHYRRKK